MEQTLARLLSPKSRRKLIEMLVSEMSYRELASRLGVTPAAVYKYVTGKAVPRDEVVVKALELIGGRVEVSTMIGMELLEAIRDYVEWALSKGVLDRSILDGIETILARASIVVATNTTNDRRPL